MKKGRGPRDLILYFVIIINLAINIYCLCDWEFMRLWFLEMIDCRDFASPGR